MAEKQGKRERELDRLALWCHTVIQFMAHLEPIGEAPRCGEFDQYAELRAAVESAGARGDLRGLKLVARDLGEWTRLQLSERERAELDRALRASVGPGLIDYVGIVEMVLTRGQIRNETEYRYVKEAVDNLDTQFPDDEVRKRLEGFVSEFEAIRSSSRGL